MKTEEIRYQSGDDEFALTLTEATGVTAMDRMAEVREALKEMEAAGDNGKAYALADRHLVFSSMRQVTIRASIAGRDVACPMSFDDFLRFPQRMTDVLVPEVSRRLNPQWFEGEDPSADDQKKVVRSGAE